MMGLVVSSNFDFDDHLPGFRAPSLFLFAQQNSREKEGGQGVGTLLRLDSATLQNVLITQEGVDLRS